MRYGKPYLTSMASLEFNFFDPWKQMILFVCSQPGKLSQCGHIIKHGEYLHHLLISYVALELRGSFSTKLSSDRAETIINTI